MNSEKPNPSNRSKRQMVNQFQGQNNGNGAPEPSRRQPQGTNGGRSSSSSAGGTANRAHAAAGKKTAQPAGQNAGQRGARPTGQKAAPGRQPAYGAAPQPARKRAAAPNKTAANRRKRGRAKKGYGGIIALLVVAALGTGIFALYSVYRARIQGDDVLPQEVKTPTWQGSDIVGGLVCGIDYDNEAANGYDSADKIGRTDMILYVRYDTKNNKASLLQIPRDTYVGEASAIKDPEGNALVTKSFTGKINSVYYNAANKENRMAALAYVINEQFRLPVDFYVTIDMEALKEIVDIKGWIEVYVPLDVSDPDHPASKIPQGWQNLTGEQVEFLLRNRHSPNYAEKGDVARLQTQQSFYSALYREFKTLQPKDLVMWMNVLTYRCKTDMGLMQLGGLAQKALSLEGANITFVRPECGVTSTASGQSVISLKKEDTAALLNQYFREPGGQVPASELGIIELPMYVGTSPADVKTMADVQGAETPHA